MRAIESDKDILNKLKSNLNKNIRFVKTYWNHTYRIWYSSMKDDYVISAFVNNILK